MLFEYHVLVQSLHAVSVGGNKRSGKAKIGLQRLRRSLPCPSQSLYCLTNGGADAAATSPAGKDLIRIVRNRLCLLHTLTILSDTSDVPPSAKIGMQGRSLTTWTCEYWCSRPWCLRWQMR